MRLLIAILIFSVGFAGHAFAARVKSCSRNDAIEAEGEASKLNLQDWGSVYKSFKRFAQCDDASIGEGYSEVIVELLVNDWKSIDELNKPASKDKRFKRFVLHHVDELMSPEEAQQIYENVRTRCPTKLNKLCKLIENELDKTPTGDVSTRVRRTP